MDTQAKLYFLCGTNQKALRLIPDSTAVLEDTQAKLYLFSQ